MRSTRQNAFTLIELLVVITVVGILVATLLPALTKARENAFRAKCLAGVRGVGLATDMYCGDNREYFPTGGFSAAYAPFEPPYQEKFVRARYCGTDAFTNKGGCPYGPDVYYNYAGNENYNGSISLGWDFCTTSYGLNPILQSGYGYNPTNAFLPLYFYGQLRRSGKLATNHSQELVVNMCCIAQFRGDYVNYLVPWAMLYTTLGDPVQFAAGDMYTRTPRHNREGLPMQLADGHAEFVPAAVVKTAPWNLAYGNGMMNVSFGLVDAAGTYGIQP